MATKMICSSVPVCSRRLIFSLPVAASLFSAWGMSNQEPSLFKDILIENV
jgi:hypothetical protein